MVLFIAGLALSKTLVKVTLIGNTSSVVEHSFVVGDTSVRFWLVNSSSRSSCRCQRQSSHLRRISIALRSPLLVYLYLAHMRQEREVEAGPDWRPGGSRYARLVITTTTSPLDHFYYLHDSHDPASIRSYSHNRHMSEEIAIASTLAGPQPNMEPPETHLQLREPASCRG